MTITIEAKPLEVKAELPGYGIFYLRRLGAAAEAEMQEKFNKAKLLIDEVSSQFEELIANETEYIKSHDEAKLSALKASDEYKKAKDAQAKADAELQKAVAYSNKCQLGLWRSDDPEAMERLLNDFTMEQIRGFYVQVMEDAEKENA